jgi:hypothetical protein
MRKRTRNRAIGTALSFDILEHHGKYVRGGLAHGMEVAPNEVRACFER